MSRIPIRTRLLAWYVLALAIILATLALLVTSRLRDDLTAEVDRKLAAASGQIAMGYRAEGVQEFVEVTGTVLPGKSSGAQLIDGSGRVLRGVGRPVGTSPLIGPDEVRLVLGGAERRASVTTSGGDQIRTLAARATGPRGTSAVLLVVESLEDVEDAVDRSILQFQIFAPIALVLAGLTGWWIVRRALVPVARMTALATAIDVDDLDRRVPQPVANDEIGRLGLTLNEMLARLQDGVQARERLIANASHELRAPLAAMRTEIDVSLRHDALDAASRAALTNVGEDIRRMSRTVDNLLTLARSDEGALALWRRECDLREHAVRAMRTLTATAEQRGVRLHLADGSATVRVDADRVEQVIVNLVDNAIRVAPSGSVVEVQLVERAEEVEISVSDAGSGVPAAAREHIFERFARGDAARSNAEGSGLGLAICAEIARAHGGRIDIRDREPTGSVFVLTLPRDATSS